MKTYKTKSEVGNKYGKLTIEREFNINKNGRWKHWCDCKCDCGNKHTAELSNLKFGHITQCTECTKKRLSISPMRGRKQSISSRLKMSTAKKKLFSDKTKHPRWEGGKTSIIGYRKKYNQEWINKNRAKKYWHSLPRRKRKINALGEHTFGEWETLKAQYNWTCPCCKKLDYNLTEDHIVPLSKGGSDNIENIQPLCKNCNSKKHTKIIKY